MQHVLSHHNLEGRMDLHAIIFKLPLRVLGPSFAKIEDDMMKVVDRENKMGPN